MKRNDLRSLQWHKLQAGIDVVVRSNRFYQRKWQQAGASATALASLDDLPALPFTTKAELLADQQAHPPYGTNLTYDRSAYVRMHQTSGTSGRRMRWLDTIESWNWILECWQEIYDAAGVTTADRLFFPFSFGPFLGFWAGFEGAVQRGQFVLAGGGLSTAARLELLLDNDITFVLCTPTYALRMLEAADELGMPLATSTVKGLILAGEPGANIPSTRRRLESGWGARVFDHSGMTEIGSLGFEAVDEPNRLYLLENHCIAEFIDPKTTDPVQEGELGELVLTNLGRWGSPLIRYRTGDLVRWRHAIESSNRPFVYLEGGILGRVDDMLWIKGNNVYPSAIEDVVSGLAEVRDFQMLAVDHAGTTALRLQIEPAASCTDVTGLPARVARAVHDRLYFHPEVELIEPGTLIRGEHKTRRLTRLKSD